ncbi:hypothetical protein BDY21DRAFT_130476 [Lineolata rhizophorae]|uniref:Uncharacterized protein n=1 Tax=Lineolata rhizophorae TaxID=578093 RepID=A0A6A6NPU0_9PEZI|nr:hypothetical protein BDY21DRAFT_130476 [Lineolata rhizophorae]
MRVRGAEVGGGGPGVMDDLEEGVPTRLPLAFRQHHHSPPPTYANKSKGLASSRNRNRCAALRCACSRGPTAVRLSHVRLPSRRCDSPSQRPRRWARHLTRPHSVPGAGGRWLCPSCRRTAWAPPATVASPRAPQVGRCLRLSSHQSVGHQGIWCGALACESGAEGGWKVARERYLRRSRPGFGPGLVESGGGIGCSPCLHNPASLHTSLSNPVHFASLLGWSPLSVDILRWPTAL